MAHADALSQAARTGGRRMRLLDDPHRMCARFERALRRDAQWTHDDDDYVISVVLWHNASRQEVGRLDDLRSQAKGPLLAIIRRVPTIRGARAVLARVDGAVMSADLELALAPTLDALLAGQQVAPRALRDLAARPSLSPRERQVLAMVVLDFSNAEIAGKLFLTESSVKSHLTSAFGKLGVKSRSEAAELILDEESGLGAGILRITPADD